MEHAEAVKTKAAERYMLGEMPDTEAESFEEHYFDCSVCANDVRDEMKVLEWGREIAKDQRVPLPMISRRRFTQWIPLAAAAALVVGLGLPMAMRSGKEGPSAEPGRMISLGTGVSRGPDDNVFVLRKGETPMPSVDVAVADGSQFAAYEATVHDDHGTRLTPVSKPAALVEKEGTIEFVLRDLPAGTYAVTIEGVRKDGKRTKIDEVRFTVRYE